MRPVPSSPKTTPVAGTPAQLLSGTALSLEEVIQTELHDAIAYSRTQLESRNREGV